MTKQCDGRHVTEDLGVASGVGLFVSFVSTCVEPQALKGRATGSQLQSGRLYLEHKLHLP